MLCVPKMYNYSTYHYITLLQATVYTTNVPIHFIGMYRNCTEYFIDVFAILYKLNRIPNFRLKLHHLIMYCQLHSTITWNHEFIVTKNWCYKYILWQISSINNTWYTLLLKLLLPHVNSGLTLQIDWFFFFLGGGGGAGKPMTYMHDYMVKIK